MFTKFYNGPSCLMWLSDAALEGSMRLWEKEQRRISSIRQGEKQSTIEQVQTDLLDTDGGEVSTADVAAADQP